MNKKNHFEINSDMSNTFSETVNIKLKEIEIWKKELPFLRLQEHNPAYGHLSWRVIQALHQRRCYWPKSPDILADDSGSNRVISLIQKQRRSKERVTNWKYNIRKHKGGMYFKIYRYLLFCNYNSNCTFYITKNV